MLETISKYKDTPIGKIPVDWEVKKLGDFGETFSGLSGKNKEDFGKGYPYIPYKNIFQNSKIDINFMDYVDIKENENQNKVQYGDIFFTTSSETADEVGMSSVLLDQIDIMYLNSFCFGFRLKNNNILDPLFSSYLLRGEKIRKELNVLAQGSTRFNMSKSQLIKLIIPIPPLSEQQKIADILSTWDKAIQETGNIIKSLEKRNKALAFSLLRGKLSDGKIKELPLSKFLTHTPREIDKPKANYLALGIRSHGKGIFHKPDSDPKVIAMEKLFEVKEHDFIVNITFAWEHAVAIISKNDEGGLVSHRFPTYVINNTIISTEYFRHYILQPFFKHMLDNISPGGAGRNRVLSKKDLMKLKIEVPNLVEQTKIAEILNTANKELQQYQQKLNNLKTQKKGLMQQLLTGKVRTV
ncbi:restriction endonuclease subunit S [Kaistella haifensis]|nr:restriction endonuclease subunit S [Kaistella haifensis]